MVDGKNLFRLAPHVLSIARMMREPLRQAFHLMLQVFGSDAFRGGEGSAGPRRHRRRKNSPVKRKISRGDWPALQFPRNFASRRRSALPGGRHAKIAARQEFDFRPRRATPGRPCTCKDELAAFFRHQRRQGRIKMQACQRRCRSPLHAGRLDQYFRGTGKRARAREHYDDIPVKTRAQTRVRH